MQGKKNLPILYILNGVIIILFSLLIFFLFNHPLQLSFSMNTVSSTISSGTVFTGKLVVPGFPLRLKIPAIKLNAFLERVGLTAQGAVAVPKGGINAAWYERSPRPGVVGSSVIVGHYGTWKNGQGSVFDNLKKLHTGDLVFVEDLSGVIHSFGVVMIKTYPAAAIVPEIFTSKDGKAHLNLITCGGVWNKLTKHYPDRLVIFTERVVD